MFSEKAEQDRAAANWEDALQLAGLAQGTYYVSQELEGGEDGGGEGGGTLAILRSLPHVFRYSLVLLLSQSAL